LADVFAGGVRVTVVCDYLWLLREVVGLVAQNVVTLAAFAYFGVDHPVKVVFVLYLSLLFV
jgi:hypothetical protein